MDNKFKQGTRVIRYFEKFNINEDVRDYGSTITDPQSDALSGKEKVYVKWDSSWYRPNPQEVLTENLMLEDEGNKKYALLEEEFTKYEIQINQKMQEAAALICEANVLAEQAGAGSLQELWESTRPLKSAMDSSGWNTSSFNC